MGSAFTNFSGRMYCITLSPPNHKKILTLTKNVTSNEIDLVIILFTLCMSLLVKDLTIGAYIVE